MTLVPPPTTINGIAARIAAAYQRLLDAVAPLTDAQLQAPILGEPFAPMLLGAYEHSEEHTEELEAHRW